MININERLHGYGQEMTEIWMRYDRVMDWMEHGYRWDMERQGIAYLPFYRRSAQSNQ